MTRIQGYAALLLALALAGCSGGKSDAAPATLPPLSTPSSTVPATATPTPSATPAQNSRGAAQFVRHYFDAVNNAYRSGHSGPLRALDTGACRTCDNFVRTVDGLGQRREHLVGTLFHVTSAEAAPVENGRAFVYVTFDAPSRTVVNQAGAVVNRSAATKPTQLVVTVKASRSGWRVDKVQTA